MKQQRILDTINSPEDVKRLRFDELPRLAADVRKRLILTISRTGGHLASNLGVVELSIAIHRIFSSPRDKIVFDVGHQSYTHKLLTGRRERFSTLRCRDGLSGFPKRSESIHDAFIAGHSSTSISVAMGLARAKKLRRERGKVVAVIGDGAFSGLAFEALNNIDETLDNLVVILNDNEMSISKNVSPFAAHLAKIRNTSGYFVFKDGVERALTRLPVVGKTARSCVSRVKSTAKSMLYHSNLFEDMGFTYLGPVDGHSFPELCSTLARARALRVPVLIHVHTQKGRGYRQAEENPGAFHGVSKFDPRRTQDNEISKNSFSEQAGLILTALGEEDKNIVAVTAAMKYATGLHHFSAKFREQGRFFDVGIAESHAVVLCSAMASTGLLPVFAVYSSFLQRAYDQLLHDCSLEETHVVLAVDRAGLVGEDGETHQGLFDISFLCTLPGVVVYSPASYEMLEQDFRRAMYEETGLVAVRYPKGAEVPGLLSGMSDEGDYFLGGSGDVLIVTYGRITKNALEAAELSGKACKSLVLDRVFPLPEGAFSEAMKADRIVFVEESAKTGGIGEQFGASLLKRGWRGEYIHKAIDYPVVPQGTVEECIESVGLSVRAIADIL